MAVYDSLSQEMMREKKELSEYNSLTLVNSEKTVKNLIIVYAS